MEIKLSEQQYKDLIINIMNEFIYTRNFYLMSLGILNGNNITLEEVKDSYNKYDDFHTNFFRQFTDVAEEQIVAQSDIDYLISIYKSIGLKACRVDKE